MADIVSFEIKGLDELQKKLEQELPADARLALRIALSAGAGDMKRAVQDEAPVEEDAKDSGFLRDHIVTKVTLRRNDLAGTAKIGPSTEAYPGRGGKDGSVSFKTRAGNRVTFSGKAGMVTAAMVGRWLEFGTRYISPRAWMTRAYESSKETARDHVIAKLREVLKLT